MAVASSEWRCRRHNRCDRSSIASLAVMLPLPRRSNGKSLVARPDVERVG
jgi:hypothetical protein